MVQNDSLLDKPSLVSRVIKTELVNWREFKFIQANNFKDFEPEAAHKLKASILGNNFTQPFYAWEDPDGIVYCLDGKHRTKMLEELISEGYDVPYLLPATFVHCDRKKEAAKLVTIYSSIYARVSQQGLFDFLKEYDIAMDEIKGQIDLPEFSFDRFEQKFDIPGIESLTDEDEEELYPDDPIIIIPGDIFQLGRHTLFVSGFEDAPFAEYMNDKARILMTDPPYNLPTDFFLKITKHDDFAMGAGEMTDDEFVTFLGKIMQKARDVSVDGAIHYIFMDFRHSWHMTEAAKKIYGSPEPKQVCVWAKDVMANGSFYRAKHEFCFLFKSGNAKHVSHIDLADRIRSNVWNYPSAHSQANPDKDELKNHPTPKPIQMIADAILDSTNEGEIVNDFFLGSGSTLIACEKTNRTCVGSEIEPKYAQSIIRRYINFCRKTGNIPEVVHVNGNLTLTDFENERTGS